MAFQGWGSQTIGGNEGALYTVTNLAEDGAGSFRYGVETVSTPRKIVFAVEGHIVHTRPLLFLNPFFTVDASTAPGAGVSFGGEEWRVQTHDGIIQYCRIRTGAEDLADDGWDNRDVLTFSHPTNDIYNIVVDHCDFLWGVDETVSVGLTAHDITVSWCLMGEALYSSLHPKGPHSMGFLVQNTSTDRKVSFHHNVIANCVGRNPKILGKLNDARCNLIYNWGSFALGGKPLHLEGPENTLAFVNNVYIPGPDTVWPSSLSPLPMVIADTAPIGGFDFGLALYFAGNLMPGVSPEDDNWDRLVYEFQTNAPLSRAYQAEGPDPNLPYVTTQPARQIERLLLAHAGATKPYKDEHHMRVVRGIRDRTGTIVSGPPQLA